MATLDPANIIACRLRSQVSGLRLRVFTTKELLDHILSYLDPASVKRAALVSRYVKLYRNHLPLNSLGYKNYPMLIPAGCGETPFSPTLASS